MVRNVIVLGDLSRHLGYRGEDAWQELMFDGFVSYYRFPLIEAVENDDSSFDPICDRFANRDEHSTTTSYSKNLTIKSSSEVDYTIGM